MTTVVQFSSTSLGVNPFAANGDTYIVATGVTVASSTIALDSSNFGSMNIAGSVIGTTTAINISSTSTSNNIEIAESGYVSATRHFWGIDLFGGGQIINNGVLSGGAGIRSLLATTINNTGTITGYDYAIQISNGVATDTNILVNSGTISSALGPSYSSFGSIDQITNTGMMIGSILTGGGNDKLLNFGHIHGDIDMSSGNDQVFTSLSDMSGYNVFGGADNDTLVNLDTTGLASLNLDAMGFENYAGKDAADYVWAGSAASSLSFNGGAGNDAFVGGSNSDYVEGGQGADYLDGGAGFNTVVYTNSFTGVSVDLFSNTASGGDANGDTILNFQAIVGSKNADNLYGNNSVNYISGGAGNDVISGFGGNDNLTGNAGNDIFYYGSAGFNNDEITDFTIGQDKIYVSTALAANFAGLTIVQSALNTVVTFAGGSLLLDNITATNVTASDFVFF